MRTLAALVLFACTAFAPAAAQTEQAPREEFSLEEIAEALERSERTNAGMARAAPRVAPPEEMDLRTRAARAFSAQIRNCWRMPEGQDGARMIVTLSFNLNEDGTLASEPRVTSPRNWRRDRQVRSAAEEAIRAVNACAPYNFRDDPVLADRYDLWREIEARFQPGS